MKKIIIHGAINTSNFGDVLFASLFYSKMCVEHPEVQTFFSEIPKYGVGEFVRKELLYTESCPLFNTIKADGLVYMSGGYFGDGEKSVQLSMHRWLRYALLGLVMTFLNKKVVILGVGGGPLYSLFNRKSFKYIMNHAKYITVRDFETKEYFKKIGVKSDIVVTSDSALIIKPEMCPRLDDDILKSVMTFSENRRLIFLHVVANKDIDTNMAEKIIPAINKFLDYNTNFRLIIGTDGIINESITELVTVVAIRHPYYYYKYTSAWKLCSLLNLVDCVVTAKLHVGIVGAALGKSVISFPEHTHKTKRFYNQIGEEDRSVPLREVNSDEAYNMLTEYCNIPIVIDDSLRELASKNFDGLKWVL